MSSYSEGQVHQLMEKLEAAGFTAADITLLGQCNNLPGMLDVLHGRSEIVKVTHKEKTSANTIVRVDRSVSPTYPCLKVLMHPELENTGSSEYDLTTAVELWLHNDQKRGVTNGLIIYDYLKKKAMLESCLGLTDALAIQKLGVPAFQKIFGNKTVYFWKSVVRRRDGHLRVPCLNVRAGKVILHWSYFGLEWLKNDPAARFANSK
ncbi:MAG: hypothetical protein AAB515_00135 [Patescibacteria group bacterium]